MSCISKILERITHNNKLYYFTENNLFFEKQFGVRAEHSTEHALTEFFDNVYNSFNQNTDTL